MPRQDLTATLETIFGYALTTAGGSPNCFVKSEFLRLQGQQVLVEISSQVCVQGSTTAEGWRSASGFPHKSCVVRGYALST